MFFLKGPFMKIFSYILIVSLLILYGCDKKSEDTAILPGIVMSADKMINELYTKYGEDQLERIQTGIHQVKDYWRKEDGDSDAFEDFIRTNFASDQETLDAMFSRFQDHLEILNGHLDRIVLNFREQADLDRGNIYPFDEIFAAYAPGAHVTDDFFKNKLAFIALLNFPLSTLQERSTQGMSWTRRQWAETRLASKYSSRIPAEISQEISQISSESEQYIARYNIWMHHLLDQDDKRLFPPKMRLLSHWNLRDELKAQYAHGKDGLPNQKMIQKVMERIVDQTIPEIVIDNPAIDWNPFSNKITPTEVNDSDVDAPLSMNISDKSEPNTRYLMLQKNYIAQKSADPYWPTMPNFIQRRFDQGREIPESRIKEMFDAVLTSPSFKKVADLIRDRLGRELQPFDIWYNGFRSRSNYSEEKLDEIVSKKYPDPSSFKKDIPRMLKKLGFSQDQIADIAPFIEVDPARGSGHAWGAKMRGAAAHLRTRIGPDGMDYKGYNIAVHELGHNVEQVISLNNIDYSLLNGVPNTAFTEAMAFVFQARDLELLGLEKPSASIDAMRTLNDFWATCEIASVALVDIAIWHWMYDHPNAKPEEIRDATLNLSKEIWNTYFAPVFRKKDVYLFGIYSHMISYPLYLADYPIGHLIAYQIEEKMKSAGSIGEEFERMARIGNVAPDLWMMNATGAIVGPDALLSATEQALKKINR
jgi:hypothetical protein